MWKKDKFFRKVERTYPFLNTMYGKKLPAADPMDSKVCR